MDSLEEINSEKANKAYWGKVGFCERLYQKWYFKNESITSSDPLKYIHIQQILNQVFSRGILNTGHNIKA